VKKALISTPFAVYGGILSKSDEILRGLYDHAVKLGVDYLSNSRKANLVRCVAGSNERRPVAFSQLLVSSGELMESIPMRPPTPSITW
jgi:hypothetical protein